MYLNDRTTDAPKLRVYLNLDNLFDLRADSIFPPALVADTTARDARLAADGFEGVQLTTPAGTPADTTLPFCGLARINTPAEADPIAQKHAERGDQCLTVHIAWGIENDDEVARLVEATLAASARHHLPIFIETHRATITQDMWRTVELTKRFPEIRFNIDLSHYYCGQEMVYGDFDHKLAFIQPILDRTGFMHGRIAAPGWIQAPIENLHDKPRLAHGADYLADFRQMWTRSMAGFRRHAGPGDVLIFAPELLTSLYYYARKFSPDHHKPTEETDRYAQALLYRDLARDCFAAAG